MSGDEGDPEGGARLQGGGVGQRADQSDGNCGVLLRGPLQALEGDEPQPHPVPRHEVLDPRADGVHDPGAVQVRNLDLPVGDRHVDAADAGLPVGRVDA